MSPLHVGLISQSTSVKFSDLAGVATALTLQVSRDVKPFWNVDALVSAYSDLSQLPHGCWP